MIVGCFVLCYDLHFLPNMIYPSMIQTGYIQRASSDERPGQLPTAKTSALGRCAATHQPPGEVP